MPHRLASRSSSCFPMRGSIEAALRRKAVLAETVLQAEGATLDLARLRVNHGLVPQQIGRAEEALASFGRPPSRRCVSTATSGGRCCCAITAESCSPIEVGWKPRSPTFAAGSIWPSATNWARSSAVSSRISDSPFSGSAGFRRHLRRSPLRNTPRRSSGSASTAPTPIVRTRCSPPDWPPRRWSTRNAPSSARSSPTAPPTPPSPVSSPPGPPSRPVSWNGPPSQRRRPKRNSPGSAGTTGRAGRGKVELAASPFAGGERTPELLRELTRCVARVERAGWLFTPLRTRLLAARTAVALGRKAQAERLLYAQIAAEQLRRPRHAADRGLGEPRAN